MRTAQARRDFGERRLETRWFQSRVSTRLAPHLLPLSTEGEP